MQIVIDRRTDYRLDAPAQLLHMELHVVPMATDRQELVSHTLTVDPPGSVNEHAHADPFGNSVQHIDLFGPVGHVTISSRAEVRTTTGRSQEPALTPLVRTLALAETSRAPFSAGVRALAQAAGDSRHPVELAGRLQALIADRYERIPDHSAVNDTAEELIESGHGSCQDFAHLMLAALRTRGIPALCVSGFLAPAHGESVSDAGHAWVRVFADGAWVGFDPANHRDEDERYIVTALGRDYDDVALVRGSCRHVGEELWGANMQVESIHQTTQ